MKIVSTGSYLPYDTLSNGWFIGKSDPEWIESKLGIKERKQAQITTADLGFYAAKKAVERAEIAPRFIDMIICATSTPAFMNPSNAAIIQYHLGAINAVSYDINAVCSGFIYGLTIAEAFKDRCHNILVIGTDAFTKITDWDHRNSVFFGDGAGAVLVRSSPEKLIYKMGTDGIGKDAFKTKWGGTFEMDSKAVYQAGMKYLPKTIRQVLKKADLTIDDIDYLLPHQASITMLKALTKEIGIPMEKVLTNMGKYANTAAASIPILLDENNFKPGDKLLLAAIGSGWTYGAIIIEW